MLRSILSGCVALCAANPASAQDIYVIDDKIEIIVLNGYHVSPDDFIMSEGDVSFSGPVSEAETNNILSRYTGGVTAEEYLVKIIADQLFEEDENIDAETVKRNLKHLTITILEIVPDDIFDPAGIQVPASEVREFNKFCERFAIGFKERWGAGAFNVYDEKTNICHNVNVFGALVALHIKRIDTHIVVIEAIDWSLAFLPDYMNARKFNRPINRKITFDIETATADEKFAEFRGAANTDDAVAVLQSARSVSH